MSLEPSGLLYIIARTGFGAAFALRDLSEGGSRGAVAADLAAEGCALLFLLGLADPRLRTAVGGWWMVLFIYAMVREAARIYYSHVEAVDSVSADSASDAETVAMPLLWLWQLVGVLPPIVIGGYLAGTSV